MTEPSGPLVSIGLPVYNGEKEIAKAIESLLAQDYANIELIISDNASTDGTGAVCAAYAAKDARVRYVRNETNIGPCRNFHQALHLARGEFFMWASHDDYWAPRFVSALVAELRRLPRAAVAMSAIEMVNEDWTPRQTLRFRTAQGKTADRLSSFELFKRIRYGEAYHLWLYALYRTSFLKRAMPEPLPEVPSMDCHFLAEIALATRFGYVDEPLQTRVIHAKAAYQRYPQEEYARLLHDGKWTEESDRAFLRDYLRKSPIIPLHRKLLALLWLRAQNWKLGSLAALPPFRWINRALSRQVG